ncbi:hypothetical protein GF338_06420 [candidate division WOR-3 bacterium]|nr:hypothetical protein [candidate division WOR-3 bacterium]
MKDDFNRYSKGYNECNQPLKTTRCPECGTWMQDGWIAAGRDSVGWHTEQKFLSRKEHVLKVGFGPKWAQAKHCPNCGTVVFRSQGFEEAREHPERFTPRRFKTVLFLVIGISLLVPLLLLAVLWWTGNL